MKNKSSVKRAVETRRLYTFEDNYLRSKYLLERRSMTYLRRLGTRIWRIEGPKKKQMPQLIAGKGHYQAGRWLSYCAWDDSHIVLVRNQRDIVTLLHELVHAMGRPYHNHGPAFAKKFFDLLSKYGKCDHDELMFAARTFGVKVP